MKAFLSTFAAFTLAISSATAADPRLKEIFDAPADLTFTGNFAKFLLGVPAADFAGFRAQLLKDLMSKELPRRRAGKALEMADNRWVEIDIPGFLAVCKDKDAQISYVAKVRVTISLVDSDPPSAIRAFQELALNENMGETAAQFFVTLASKDPKLALQSYLDLDKDQKFRDGVAIIIRAWAQQDPAAAWEAVIALPPKVAEPRISPSQLSDTGYLRAVACAAAARKDEALANRLLDSVTRGKDLARIRNFLISELAKTEPDIALAWTRKFNTPEIVRTFCGHVRWGTDEETLKKLIALAPKEQLRDYLIAFFTESTDVLLPKFRYARLIPQVPDQKLRHEMILAIVAEAYGKDFRSNTHTPLPGAVVDAILAEGTELLATAMPRSQRILIIRAILAKNSDLGLSWVLGLSEQDWQESRYDLSRMWPPSNLSVRVTQLISGKTPREAALAELLAERWWENEPVAAFSHIKEKYSNFIHHRFKPELFLKGCGGDLAKARELLATVPDPTARAAALNQFAITSAKDGPPAATLAIVLERIKDPASGKSDNECGPVTYHKSPDMDDLISKLPDERQADRDRLLGLRAPALFQQAEEERAHVLWRRINNDKLFFNSMTSGARSGMDPTKIKDWDSLVATIAMRPASEQRTYIFKDFSATMARYAPLAGIAAGGSTQEPEARALILIAIATTLENPKNLEVGLAVVRTLPENKETQPIHAAWRAASARLDPAQGWKIAIERGLDTDEGRRLGVIAIDKLANKDAKAALALLLDAGPAGMRHEFLTPVARGLIATDPATAFRTALAMPPEVRSSLLNPALTAWVKIDPTAACAASLEAAAMSAGDRQLFCNCLREWLRADEVRAIAWVRSLENAETRDQGLRVVIPAIASKNLARASKLFAENPSIHNDAMSSIAIANSMAVTDYAAACRFLLEHGRTADIPTVASAMQRFLLPWFAADPAVAAEFVKSFKASPLVDHLNQNLSSLLLPRYSTALDGWNPPPSREIQRNAKPDTATIRARIEAMPDGAAKIRAIEDLIQSWISEPRHHAEIHALLNTLPEVESLRIHASLLSKNGTGIPGFEEAFLYPEPANPPVTAIFGRLSTTLLHNDLRSALHAAAELPDSRFDHFTIRILAAFPMAVDAETAIQSIPDPTARDRAMAWFRQKN